MQVQNKISTSGLIAITLLNRKAIDQKLPKKFQGQVNKAEAPSISKRWAIMTLPILVVIAVIVLVLFILQRKNIISEDLFSIIGYIALGAFSLLTFAEYALTKNRAAKSLNKKIGQGEALEAELTKLAQDYPEIYQKIIHAYDSASERKKVKFFLEHFMTEVFFICVETNEEILPIEEARRLTFSVISGKQFIEAIAIKDSQLSKKYLDELKLTFNTFESLLAIFKETTILPRLIVERSTEMSKAIQDFLGEVFGEVASEEVAIGQIEETAERAIEEVPRE